MTRKNYITPAAHVQHIDVQLPVCATPATGINLDDVGLHDAVSEWKQLAPRRVGAIEDDCDGDY